MTAKPRALALAIALALLLVACSGEIDGIPGPRAAADDQVAAGRQLLASYGCGSCHTIPGIPGADAKAAPPLDRFYERSYIAGRLPNTEANLAQWIQNPQQIDPGNAMPDLGVTQEQAQAMVAYLYHPPSLIGP
jgi:cytochrome c1